MANAAPYNAVKAPRCTGKLKHAFCAHLLANLIPRQMLDKQYMYDMMKMIYKLDQVTVEHLPTGSRAELLNLPTFIDKNNDDKLCVSDFDIMRYAGFITEHLQIHRLPETYVISDPQLKEGFWKTDLILVTSDDVNPGFCFVCSGTSTKHSSSSNVEHLLFYTHASLLQWTMSPMSSDGSANTNSFVGAAMTYRSLGEEYEIQDEVPCFVCDFWPDQARSVFERHHNLWPTKALLHACEATCRLLIVRKAHPLSKNPDVEFRFSFSLLEIALSRSLPDEVRYVYLTVKLLCKVTPLADTPLKTYYLKTILYWIASYEDISTWQYSNFRQNTVSFFIVVARVFRDKNIPNFFVPEHNLLEHLGDGDCEEVADLIDLIIEDMCNVVLSTVASVTFLEDHYDIRNYDIRYDRAKDLFRRYIRAAVNPMLNSPVAPNEIRREFERPLHNNPFMINGLVEYGLFMWIEGHDVCSFVSWLNALVVYFSVPLGWKLPRMVMHVLFTNADRKLLDPFLRLLMNVQESPTGVWVAHAHVLALYYLVTRHGISQQSAQHLIALVEPSTSKEFFAEEYDIHVEEFTFISHYIIKYCRYHGTYGEQVLMKLTATKLQDATRGRMRENVYSVCQAVCEYVKHYICFCHLGDTHRLNRRHSFSGTTVVSRLSKEQDWKTRTQIFARDIGVSAENCVNPTDVMNAINSRFVVTKNLLRLVDYLTSSDDPEKQTKSESVSIGLSHVDDGSEFLMHTLEGLYSGESEEARKILMSNFMQANVGIAKAHHSSTEKS